MKKTLAILLALILVLANVAALAAEGDPDFLPTEGNKTFTVTKVYTTTGVGKDISATIFPKETLAFESTPDGDNPTTENITVGTSNTYAITANPKDGSIITVTLPTYTKPGLYKYTVKEIAGKTQGVTYTDATIEVGVVVEFDTTNPKQLVVGTMYGVIKNADGEKDDGLTNDYAVGNLKVKKTVEGNLADKNKYFTFKVTFTTSDDNEVRSDITYSGGKYTDTDAGTITGNGWKTNSVSIELKADDEIVFENIPDGVGYTVEETSVTGDDRITNASDKPNNTNAYVVSGEDGGTITKASEASVTINNKKNIEIDTGISMETVPYIMILALVLAGAALLVLRKREDY